MLSVAISLALLRIELPPLTVVDHSGSVCVLVVESPARFYDTTWKRHPGYRLSCYSRAGHGGARIIVVRSASEINRLFWGYHAPDPS